jgi:hypothetical protein
MLRGFGMIGLLISGLLSVVGCTKDYLRDTETATIQIPQEGWEITFKSPPITYKVNSHEGPHHIFAGSNGNFGFDILVENQKFEGSTNKDSFNYYWPQYKLNAYAGMSDVIISETPKYIRVRFTVYVPSNYDKIPVESVVYYFSFHGRWVSVLFQVAPMSTKGSFTPEILNLIDNTFSYGVTKSGITSTGS